VHPLLPAFGFLTAVDSSASGARRLARDVKVIHTIAVITAGDVEDEETVAGEITGFQRIVTFASGITHTWWNVFRQ